MENVFEIKDNFCLNGKPFKIISGGIHYFRIVPEYWRDRLEKLKAMGCNTVETYVPWNLHEPKKGKFDFKGILDLKKFVLMAQELGLWVIVRPSPFICAEWEFGGLPAWLLAEDNMKLRCSYAPYLNHIGDYYKKLFEILTPLQVNNGGPIILMQVENEYGYYGDDKNYLRSLAKLMRDNGAVVPFVTSDGPWGDLLSYGSFEGALPTGNFGSKSEEQFKSLSKATAGGPLMCMEFWVGWFDSWGEEHHRADLQEHIKDLDYILQTGNVNIYMFIGGTNFGFTSGANYNDVLKPDVTSYDYDAVLTEWGDTTEKYEAFKNVISKYTEIPNVEFTTRIVKKTYGSVELKDKVSLLNIVSDIAVPVESVTPTCMEKLGQNYGYVLYSSETSNKVSKIKLLGANDRANILVDKKPATVLYDRELLQEAQISSEESPKHSIDILVENMGRVNFGVLIEKQHKGIKDGVMINGRVHYGWKQYTLPLDNLDKVDFSKEYTEGQPSFYKFELEIQEKGDTFLDTEGFGKGCVFVNGFNIGRFWEKGPQKRLYIPAPLLKQGKNEIILFETDGKSANTILLTDTADLG